MIDAERIFLWCLRFQIFIFVESQKRHSANLSIKFIWLCCSTCWWVQMIEASNNNKKSVSSQHSKSTSARRNLLEMWTRESLMLNWILRVESFLRHSKNAFPPLSLLQAPQHPKKEKSRHALGRNTSFQQSAECFANNEDVGQLRRLPRLWRTSNFIIIIMFVHESALNLQSGWRPVSWGASRTRLRR